MTSEIPTQESVVVHPPDSSALLIQAIEEIRALKARNTSEFGADPIAIIGMANRFPGDANTPEEFWDLLRRGEDLTGSRSEERGGFLNRIDEFDPAFFGISPQEAPLIDPQHRLLLEVAWQALEDALVPDSVLRRFPVGLFAGMSHSDYAQQTLYSGNTGKAAGAAALGAARSMGPGRVAYSLGLMGPVMQVDTSCSSSLVAVHLACQSLRNGECEMALAGGVNLALKQDLNVALRQLGALAPDGLCKTFDAKADGYARGEGCGMVLLRRLSSAVEAGDRIRAVILGSAVNHDGRSNGLTAPNGSAQVSLIERALRMANLQPKDIQYVEAHGTGTRLGDPVELMALARVFGERTNGDFRVGSVKSNIGHLESAAGIAGLIKTVLMVEHGEIPPSLHVHELNPHFEWDKYGFQVPRRTVPWPSGEIRRACGVSAFGMSGTNAHVIVSSAPRMERKAERQDRRPNLLCISARSEWAALELKRSHAKHLSNGNSDDSLGDYCYSTRVGRTTWPYRVAVVGANAAALVDALATAIPRESGRDIKIAFRLHSRGDLGQIDEFIQEELHDEFERCPEQPLYALQCGLGDLWKAWGIEPTAIVGDAGSERAVRYLRGEISLAEGLGGAGVRPADDLDSSDVESMDADLVIAIGPALAESAMRVVPSLSPGRTSGESLVAAAAEVWLAGGTVDWARFDAGYGRRRVPLPQYPFQRSKYWADLRTTTDVTDVPQKAQSAAVEAAAPVEPLRDRLAELTPAMRRKETVAYIRDLIAEKLGYPPSLLPSTSEGFFQIGMDSLAAAEILNAIRAGTGCDVSATDLFAHSTVETLADFVVRSMFPEAATLNAAEATPQPTSRLDAETQSSALLVELEELKTLLRSGA